MQADGHKEPSKVAYPSKCQHFEAVGNNCTALMTRYLKHVSVDNCMSHALRVQFVVFFHHGSLIFVHFPETSRKAHRIASSYAVEPTNQYSGLMPYGVVF